jgi:hypothetical protein
MELLGKAAGQGHVWAMYKLGGVLRRRKEYERAVGRGVHSSTCQLKLSTFCTKVGHVGWFS